MLVQIFVILEIRPLSSGQSVNNILFSIIIFYHLDKKRKPIKMGFFVKAQEVIKFQKKIGIYLYPIAFE